LRRILWLALLVIAVAAALAAASGWAPRAFEAAEVLADIAAGPGPSRLKNTRPPPRREPVAYVARGRQRWGELYLSGEDSRASLVLVPGASRTGKDDPLFVAFAETLARARFTVLVPDIPSMRALRVSADNALDIADAVAFLAELDGDTVGLAAISYAVGPALLAALEPEIRDKVRFVLAIGGYYDSIAALTYFTTGYFRESPDHAWHHQEPNAYGRWVFVRANAARVADPRDRTTLAAIAERKLADLDWRIDDLVATLGPEGKAILALLDNRDPDAVPALVEALPEAVRSDIEALDLRRRDLSPLAARLILVHGRDDPIIPYTESLALAAAAPPGLAHLYVFDGLAHVKLSLGDLDDILALWRAVYRLLDERDGTP
jgi:pimeloyl-ACP methyl ester carboxylesterase